MRDLDGFGEAEAVDPEGRMGSISLTNSTGVMLFTFMSLFASIGVACSEARPQNRARRGAQSGRMRIADFLLAFLR
jgi:hypothetical protein